MQVLWTEDQLHKACGRGEVFTGFSEGPLLFPPTYKFDVGTDNYDSSAKVSLWTSSSFSRTFQPTSWYNKHGLTNTKISKEKQF